jgi:hypothetical protein
MVAVLSPFLTAAQASNDVREPLKVSQDGHFLVQSNGAPFFWLADTAWTLFQRLDHDEADQYFRDRASKGFNLIQAVAFGGPIDSIAVPNRYGQLALLHADPEHPNPRYFENIDWMVDRAAQYGLRIAMLPVWGGNQIGGWASTEHHIFTPKNAAVYGRWLGKRYRGRGIIWILGGDANPIGISHYAVDKQNRDLTIVDYRPIYDAMASGIIDGEGDKPLITYHLTCCSWPGTARPRASLYLNDRSWFSVDMLQSSHFRNPKKVMDETGADFAWDATRNYEFVGDEYNSTPSRPVIDGEPRYEDLSVDVESDPAVVKFKGIWTAYDVRNAAYHAVFAGAAGHTYGNTSVWQFFDPKYHRPVDAPKALPWEDAISQPGAAQMQYLKALMLSRPYISRIPDQSLVIGDAGQGESHVSATRDRDGSYAMVFIPKGQPVTIDLGKITGLHAVAWWFNPKNGAATRIGSNFSTTGTTTFVPTSSGEEEDWVLVIDDENKRYSMPGGAAP